MPTATPETLVDVVRQVFILAQQRAAGQVEQILDQIEADAEAGWTALQNLVDSRPDWSTLLLLILTKIRDLDPDHIAVGTMQHPEWKRLLTLSYHVEGDVDASVLLGLALTEPSAAHGILLRVNGKVDQPFGDQNGFHLRVISDGDDATWEIPFGGGMQLPQQRAVIDVTLSWPPGLALDREGLRLSVGPLYLHAHADTTKPKPRYQTILGIGDHDHQGVDVHLDVTDQLGLLGGIVAITPAGAGYSPNVRLASGESPSFSLAYRGDETKGA